MVVTLSDKAMDVMLVSAKAKSCITVTPLPMVTEEREAYLELVLAVDKPVMVVDYVYAGARDEVVEDFLKKAVTAGYSPYAATTDRALDRLVVFAGQGE